MEGLLGQPMTLDAPLDDPRFQERLRPRKRSREERLIHRWLAFLFLTMIGFLALAYLTAALLSV